MRDNDCNEDIFWNAFHHAAIGMALVAPDGTWLKVNDALCRIVGYSSDELMSKTFQDITHPEDLDEDLAHVKGMLARTIDTYQMEKRYFHKNGNIVYILLSVSMVSDKEGEPRFFISQIQDITRQKLTEEELVKKATQDYLTQVANRRYFFEHASREIIRGGRFNEPQAILMIDIDHFKKINDRYGHGTGDEILKLMATTCLQSIRSFDLFGRIGGEEFAVLLINTDASIAGMIAERIRRNVETNPFMSPDAQVEYTVSIGVATFSGGSETLDHRLKQADMALYNAKKKGRNRVEIVSEEADGHESHEKMRTSFIRLAWRKEYECESDLINQQHIRLFAIANDLLSGIVSGLPNEQVEQSAKELVEHVEQHFKDESAIFRAHGFPLSEEHDKIHDDLFTKTLELIDRYKSSRLSVGELFDFLARVVVQEHLLKEDRKFFPYLKKET